MIGIPQRYQDKSYFDIFSCISYTIPAQVVRSGVPQVVVRNYSHRRGLGYVTRGMAAMVALFYTTYIYTSYR